MIRATLYVMACSSKNRLRRRLARLREPRYLFGAIVGTAYLYFSIYGRFRMNQRATAARGGASMSTLIPGASTIVPFYCGVGLMVAAALSWLFPGRSPLLEFSAAETALLVPAPISRRQLLIYRVLRSQIAVLFGSLIFALVFPRGSIDARVRGLLAIWLLMSTAQVFFTGISLWRSGIARNGIARRMRGLSMVLTAGGGIFLAIGLAREAVRAPITNVQAVGEALGRVLERGSMPIVVQPFVALARPFFAAGWAEFLPAFAVALAIYLAIVGWMLVSDAMVDLSSEPRVETPAPAAGRRRAVRYKARHFSWLLAPEGRAETAFVWKATLQTFRVVDRRTLLRIAVVVLWFVIVPLLSTRVRGFAQVLGTFGAFAAVFFTLLGPQMIRTDLRSDLQNLETMKTWPVRASAVVRGEMLWPGILVSAIVWLLLIMTLALSQNAFPQVSVSLRLAVGTAAMIFAPALIFAQYTIHNAAALFFPAWIASGQGRPRGVDAMGQRLILFGGILLVMLIALLPSALIAGVLWVAFARFVGAWILIPAALMATVIVALEVLMATEALGPAYERLDLTSIERAE